MQNILRNNFAFCDMNTKKERLLQLINYYCNGKSTVFAKKLGVSPSTVSSWLARDSFDYDLIFAKCENISPEWLLTGEGEMLKSPATVPAALVAKPKLITTAGSQESALDSFTEVMRKTPHAIPLVSVKAVGGFANEHFAISESDVLSYYVIPKFQFLQVDFMIEVIGDSMIPRLYPGDIIACTIIHNPNFIQWNQPHLLATREQGLIVKRIKKSSDEDCLLAVSENSDYEPIDIPKDEITGIARVVGVIHLE